MILHTLRDFCCGIFTKALVLLNNLLCVIPVSLYNFDVCYFLCATIQQASLPVPCPLLDVSWHQKIQTRNSIWSTEAPCPWRAKRSQCKFGFYPEKIQEQRKRSRMKTESWTVGLRSQVEVQSTPNRCHAQDQWFPPSFSCFPKPFSCVSLSLFIIQL